MSDWKASISDEIAPGTRVVVGSLGPSQGIVRAPSTLTDEEQTQLGAFFERVFTHTGPAPEDRSLVVIEWDEPQDVPDSDPPVRQWVSLLHPDNIVFTL